MTFNELFSEHRLTQDERSKLVKHLALLRFQRTIEMLEKPGCAGAPAAGAERSDDQKCSRCGRYENGSRPCPNGDRQCPVSYAPSDLGVGE